MNKAFFCAEALRMYPALDSLERQCTKDYDIELPNGRKFTIKKGTSMLISLRPLLRDPEIYGSDAEKFNPDRFDEAFGGLEKYTKDCLYFVFGAGPRCCLGKYFVLLQMKCCIAHVLLNFEVKLSYKMPMKPEYDPNNLIPVYKGGVWLDYIPLK